MYDKTGLVDQQMNCCGVDSKVSVALSIDRQ